MTDDPETETAVRSEASDHSASPRPLTPAAERALAEAAARRAAADAQAAAAEPVREINGRKGPEPVRYGDWENKGLASDF
jgi:hypothetical protein